MYNIFLKHIHKNFICGNINTAISEACLQKMYTNQLPIKPILKVF